MRDKNQLGGGAQHAVQNTQLGAFRRGGKRFSLLNSIQTGSVTHPFSYPMGIVDLFEELKRPGRESDHSPSSADIKYGGDIALLFHTFYNVVLNLVNNVYSD
jgi:hypothetical protein